MSRQSSRSKKQNKSLSRKALGFVLNPQSYAKAAGVVRGISQKASQQDGANFLENYQLLFKKAAIGVGVSVAAVGIVGCSAGIYMRKRSQKRQIEKAVAEALERERLKENGEIPEEDVDFYQAWGKRLCDLGLSIAALPVVLAVCAASAVAIKQEDGGPVFYNSTRVGLNGREFTMFKLRSMKENAPDIVMEDGSTYNGADDPRMTRTGEFLRRTSLDEIPQFLNVLRGEMSVIGPRPDLPREVKFYEGEEKLKLTVKPGITGYAAVYGRNALPWHDRLALDVDYVKKMSFPLDLKVFFKTFTAVFKQEGIFVDE